MKNKIITMVIAVLVGTNIFVTKADAREGNYSILNKEDVKDYYEITNKYKGKDSTNYNLKNDGNIEVKYEAKVGVVPVEAWEGKEVLIYEVVDKIGKPIEEVTYADIAEIKMLTLPGVPSFSIGKDGQVIEIPAFEGELPEILKEFKTLRILDLSLAPITVLPEWFYSLTELRDVNLKFTVVSEISESIKNLVNLNNLNLMGTQISDLPVEISGLEKLEAINVATLPFTVKNEMPEEVFDIKNLTDLEFPFAGLTEIPQNIKKLTKLEYVNFAFNSLDKFPEELYGLKNLELIILAANKISSVDEKISQLTNLNGLIVPINRITKLPQSLKDIKGESNLYIDASINFISKAPVLSEGQNIDLCSNFLECSIHSEENFEENQILIYKELGLKNSLLEIKSGEEITNNKLKELANVLFVTILSQEKIVDTLTDVSMIDLQFEMVDESGKVINLKDTKNLPVGLNKLKVKLVDADIKNEKAISELNINVKDNKVDPEVPPTEPEVPPTNPVVPPTPPTTPGETDKKPALPNTGGNNPMSSVLLGLLSTASGITLFRKRK